jgi:hypothetical protein
MNNNKITTDKNNQSYASYFLANCTGGNRKE